MIQDNGIWQGYKNVTKDVLAPTLTAQVLFGSTAQSATGTLVVDTTARSLVVSLSGTASESGVYVKLADADEKAVTVTDVLSETSVGAS
jgi:hypothetical protein